MLQGEHLLESYLPAELASAIIYTRWDAVLAILLLMLDLIAVFLHNNAVV